MFLPLNCTVSYHPGFLSPGESSDLYRLIAEDFSIDKHRIPLVAPGEVTAFGKLMFIDEADRTSGRFPTEAYGMNFVWPPAMAALRQRVHEHTGLYFGSCVCIYYPDGNIGVDYHADYAAFGDTTVLPSLSLGAARTFLLREKATGKVHDILLEEGSLIIMGEHCQERYEHCLPEDPACQAGRINLTFRQVGFD